MFTSLKDNPTAHDEIPTIPESVICITLLTTDNICKFTGEYYNLVVAASPVANITQAILLLILIVSIRI